MSEPIRVEGAEETAAALQKYGEAITNDVEPAGKVAQLGASGARSIAPVITGELASGYTMQERFVVNDVSYATFVEYGTSRMDAQFPIQRSLDAIGSEAERIYSDWSQQKAKEVGFEPTG